jgi:hypothetical protein
MIRLSKILSYLIDNLYIAMLSPIKEWGQGQRGGPEAPLPDLELFAKDGRNKIGNVPSSPSFVPDASSGVLRTNPLNRVRHTIGLSVSSIPFRSRIV